MTKELFMTVIRHFGKMSSPQDVSRFLLLATDFLGTAFTPAAIFEQYELDGLPIFSEAEAHACNALLNQAFGLCEMFNEDIYALGMAFMEAQEKAIY